MTCRYTNVNTMIKHYGTKKWSLTTTVFTNEASSPSTMLYSRSSVGQNPGQPHYVLLKWGYYTNYRTGRDKKNTIQKNDITKAGQSLYKNKCVRNHINCRCTNNQDAYNKVVPVSQWLVLISNQKGFVSVEQPTGIFTIRGD